jgi:hypothetical protein
MREKCGIARGAMYEGPGGREICMDKKERKRASVRRF